MHDLTDDGAGKTEARLELTLPAALAQVGPARRRLADWAGALDFAPDDVQAVALAFGEACTNAVAYGGVGREASIVTVRAALVRRNCLQIDVQNQGNGFHPDLDALCVMPDDFSFATHGRGFPLMRALCDDLAVFTTEGGDTVVRLIKSRSS